MYNYQEAIYDDVKEAIFDNFSKNEIREKLEQDKYSFEEELNDLFWDDDNITGNASGSYWCNSYKAAECLMCNWDLLNEAICEMGCYEENPINKGEEWCDVIIRCYLLSNAISNVLDDLEDELLD